MQDRVFITNPRIGTLQVEVSPFAFIWDTTLHQFPGGVVTLPNNAKTYVVINIATLVSTTTATPGNSSYLYLDCYVTNHQKITQTIRLSNGPVSGSQNASSDVRLIEMVQAGAYQMTSRTLDSDNVITSADVVWPDGATGMYDIVEKNNTFLVADSFQVTYISDTIERVVLQPLVTRNASGYITLKPALTVNDI